MKKVIATILSLLAILSICSVSVFALQEDNNELNQERQIKRKSRTIITERKRRELKEAYERIKENEPNLSNQQICERVGQEFEIETNTVRRHVLNKEKNTKAVQNQGIDFEAYKKCIEANIAKLKEQARQCCSEDDERELNQEKQTKGRSRTPITEEKRSELKEAYEQIKEQEPNLSDQQIYEKVGQKFEIETNLVRYHVLDKKDQENKKEKARQYYQENQEKIKEHARQYYQENKDEICERQKQYYQENQEKIKKRQKQYREENQEKIKEHAKQYYQENKTQMRQDRIEGQQ